MPKKLTRKLLYSLPYRDIKFKTITNVLTSNTLAPIFLMCEFEPTFQIFFGTRPQNGKFVDVFTELHWRRRVKLRTFKNPRWRTAAILKNKSPLPLTDHTTRYLKPTMLYTDVDGQCVTSLSHWPST